MTQNRRSERAIRSRKFRRPDDFAWAPIDFPGVHYDRDGTLGNGIAKATAHLIDAIRQQGYDLTSMTRPPTRLPVRAENPVHGSDQQICSPGPGRDDHRSCACSSCSP